MYDITINIYMQYASKICNETYLIFDFIFTLLIKCTIKA